MLTAQAARQWAQREFALSNGQKSRETHVRGQKNDAEKNEMELSIVTVLWERGRAVLGKYKAKAGVQLEMK